VLISLTESGYGLTRKTQVRFLVMSLSVLSTWNCYTWSAAVEGGGGGPWWWWWWWWWWWIF
jgi:hypothetical protein